MHVAAEGAKRVPDGDPHFGRAELDEGGRIVGPVRAAAQRNVSDPDIFDVDAKIGIPSRRHLPDLDLPIEGIGRASSASGWYFAIRAGISIR